MKKLWLAFLIVVQPRLKRIVHFRLDYRLNGRVSESDVIQETYVRAAQRLNSYLAKEDMPFFVWLRLEISQKLHEIHRHHFGAEMRDVRKEMKLGDANNSEKTSLALAAHIVAQMTSPSRLVERAEQIAKLETTLNEMNELDREVIALRHFEELSNLETAKISEHSTCRCQQAILAHLETAERNYGNGERFRWQLTSPTNKSPGTRGHDKIPARQPGSRRADPEILENIVAEFTGRIAHRRAARQSASTRIVFRN